MTNNKVPGYEEDNTPNSVLMKGGGHFQDSNVHVEQLVDNIWCQ